jgi:hypothetical protein
MRQSRDEMAQNLARRLCWDVAHRDESRAARPLYGRDDGLWGIIVFLTNAAVLNRL